MLDEIQDLLRYGCPKESSRFTALTVPKRGSTGLDRLSSRAEAQQGSRRRINYGRRNDTVIIRDSGIEMSI